ncbi:hypothetical protein cand_034120 [Cryptosporidium andersoni]|uniref:C-type lectin domain-containing protein n=1 Tax=Cryptosporidium andersoni TaxID=117008 RepID=A0A1J4MVQ2_9CRYT|nr:hypothetical protein cand_034120 [Cryptosporidium andersoni]
MMINSFIHDEAIVLIWLTWLFHGILSSSTAGRAICPVGWTPNSENTRCFKVVTFDKPRTYSYGFRVCNELGSTAVTKASYLGEANMHEYPVTLATVHKKTDDKAVKRVLNEFPNTYKTANGCFVGLRKYTLFRYPPGWYWIDEEQPVSIKDSDITWSSNYSASWLVKLTFPFEKCGFYDEGGLGRRPCWLIDSELSCAICGTVAYDSGGGPPGKYSELIQQVDEIFNKEPKFDIPQFSSLNCSDLWSNNATTELCNDVSNIINNAWILNTHSNTPNINFEWRESKYGEGNLLNFNNTNPHDIRLKQGKYSWSSSENISENSDSMVLLPVVTSQKYYGLDVIENNKYPYMSRTSTSTVNNEFTSRTAITTAATISSNIVTTIEYTSVPTINTLNYIEKQLIIGSSEPNYESKDMLDDLSLMGFGEEENEIMSQYSFPYHSQEVLGYQDNINTTAQVDLNNESLQKLSDRPANSALIIGSSVGGAVALGSIILCCVACRNNKDNDGDFNDENQGNIQISNISMDSSIKENSLEPACSDSVPAFMVIDKSVNHNVNLTQSDQSVISIEDTTFSPIYTTQNGTPESGKPQFCVAQSQATALNLHSNNNIAIHYDTRCQNFKTNALKSAKYHEFYYSQGGDSNSSK